MKRWISLLVLGTFLICCTACAENHADDNESNTVSSYKQYLSSKGPQTTTSQYDGESNTMPSNVFSPLEEAYAHATERHDTAPDVYRDVGELQLETQEIIEIDGQYYQSYVSGSVDIRYVFISRAEFPQQSAAIWDWYTVGTANTYSLDLLGEVDEGYK